MTDLRKAAEMALDYIRREGWTDPQGKEVWLALRQALSQPKQESVATYEEVMETMLLLRNGTLEQQQIYTNIKDTPLYTAPLKREEKIG